MTSFHDLRIRRRELLNELDEMAAAVAELNDILDGVACPVPEEFTEHYEHRAWLQRQQAGVLVILNETERALIEFSVDGWDDA